jgi:hypothetical protein
MFFTLTQFRSYRLISGKQRKASKIPSRIATSTEAQHRNTSCRQSWRRPTLYALGWALQREHGNRVRPATHAAFEDSVRWSGLVYAHRRRSCRAHGIYRQEPRTDPKLCHYQPETLVGNERCSAKCCMVTGSRVSSQINRWASRLSLRPSLRICRVWATSIAPKRCRFHCISCSPCRRAALEPSLALLRT